MKKRAADLLGISLKTLYNRLEEYGNEERAAMLAKSVLVEQRISLGSGERGLLN